MKEFEFNDDTTQNKQPELQDLKNELGKDGLPVNIPGETSSAEANLTEFPEDLEIKVGQNHLHSVMMQTQPVD